MGGTELDEAAFVCKPDSIERCVGIASRRRLDASILSARADLSMCTGRASHQSHLSVSRASKLHGCAGMRLC